MIEFVATILLPFLPLRNIEKKSVKKHDFFFFKSINLHIFFDEGSGKEECCVFWCCTCVAHMLHMCVCCTYVAHVYVEWCCCACEDTQTVCRAVPAAAPSALSWRMMTVSTSRPLDSCTTSLRPPFKQYVKNNFFKKKIQDR